MKGIAWAFSETPTVDPYLHLSDNPEEAKALHAQAVVMSQLQQQATDAQ